MDYFHPVEAAATSVLTEYVFCESLDSAHDSQISSTFKEAETIWNCYFWLREKFLGVSCNLQSFLFQNFTTNPAKVRNGHFWTNLIIFLCIFEI